VKIFLTLCTFNCLNIFARFLPYFFGLLNLCYSNNFWISQNRLENIYLVANQSARKTLSARLVYTNIADYEQQFSSFIVFFVPPEKGRSSELISGLQQVKRTRLLNPTSGFDIIHLCWIRDTAHSKDLFQHRRTKLVVVSGRFSLDDKRKSTKKEPLSKRKLKLYIALSFTQEPDLRCARVNYLWMRSC